MTRRPGWAWVLAMIGVTTVGVGGVLGWADPQQRPTAADDALRHEIEDLAKIFLFRIEEARAAEKAEADRKAPEPPPVDGPKWASALANAEVARLALKEYRDGAYPLELSSAESERKLAREDFDRTKLRKDWADKEMASGRKTVSQNELVRDIVAFQLAEIALKKSEMKVDILKKFTYPKEIARLQGAIDAADRAIRQQKEQVQLPPPKEVEPAQAAISVSLTELEREAIVALDEAMRLREEKEPAAARSKLREADRLWRDSEPSRIERRYAQLQERIRRSADETRRLGR